MPARDVSQGVVLEPVPDLLGDTRSPGQRLPCPAQVPRFERRRAGLVDVPPDEALDHVGVGVPAAFLPAWKIQVVMVGGQAVEDRRRLARQG